MIFRAVTSACFMVMVLALLPSIFTTANRWFLSVQGNTCFYKGEVWKTLNAELDWTGTSWTYDPLVQEASRCFPVFTSGVTSWYTPEGKELTKGDSVEWRESVFDPIYPKTMIMGFTALAPILPLAILGVALLIIFARDERDDHDDDSDQASEDEDEER